MNGIDLDWLLGRERACARVAVTTAGFAGVLIRPVRAGWPEPLTASLRRQHVSPSATGNRERGKNILKPAGSVADPAMGGRGAPPPLTKS